MEYKIEKGVPMPSVREDAKGKEEALKSTLLAMEVGDSFFVKGWKQQALYRFLSMAKSFSGRAYTTRKSEDGFRVWRVQ